MSAPLWTSEELVAATGGTAHGRFEATGVTFDSREVAPGDLFVALPGVRDGHDFVAQAMAKGAAGALVSRDVGGPSVVVGGEVLAALQALGVAARERSAARRAAVTGSVGKTSVTQALKAALDLAGPAHASVKSFNNHIGVPLTLARMPRATERAVFEIGMNHAGEIAPLTRLVRPHAALVTTVGPVHTENFADGEAGVAREKAAVFEGLEPGGLAVVNADNRWTGVLREAAGRAGAEVATFGSDAGCDARLISVVEHRGLTIEAVVRGRPLKFAVPQSGAHWGLNSLAVLLTAEALGVPYDTTVAALEAFEPLAGRGETRGVRARAGAFTLVDESYNANPISMAAAIRSLAARPAAGRRIAALTDMLELGPEAARFHAAVADDVDAAGVDLVFAAGPLMASLFDALPPSRRGGYAETAEALAPLLAAAAGPGDVIMVKGSNGSRARVLAEALLALETAGADA